MRDLVAGVTYVLRALRLLAQAPRLWRYVVVPILVNLLIGVTFYLGLLLAGFVLVNRLVAGLPTWAAGLGPLLQVLLLLGLLLVTGMVLVRFAVVLAAPWYDQLADQVAALRQGRRGPARAGSGILRSLAEAVVDELQKLLFVAAVGLALLLLNIIPGPGTVLATAGGLALGAVLACLDFYHAPRDGRHLRVRGKLALVRHSWLASLSFGLVCVGLNSLPFLNLLTIPVCVVAGTLLACDRVQREEWARPMR